MSMKTKREAMADWAAVVLAIGAVAFGGSTIWERLSGQTTTPNPGEAFLAGWEDELDGSVRMGYEDAPVTIVEFGDYECPSCRALEPQLRRIREEYPDDVAMIYKHLPLTYHPNAYQAARLAECAKEHGRFLQAHEFLFGLDSLGGLTPESVVAAVGILEEERFLECATQTDPVPTIEDDRVLAQEWGAKGTPTIVVNGVMLDMSAGATEIVARIEEELGR